MKFISSAIFIAALTVFSVFPAFAQENEPVVIDEVVAQINDGVLTLSRIKREKQTIIDSMVQEGKTPEAAKAEIEAKEGELIANLINEELILQKGKEEGLDADVEAQINQRFVQIMKEQNLKTLDALYKAMEAQGVRPNEIREMWRKQIAKDAVLQREVDQKIYWDASGKQLRDFFEANKAKFTKPETVTLSEIFLNYAGRDEAAVLETAKQLVARLRKGESFEKLAEEKSERPDAKEKKGKVGSFPVAELNEQIAGAIKNTKAGEVTEPFAVEGGIEIIRVDERIAASDEAFFDENAVRRAYAMERIPEGRKKFMMELRRDAFIKVSEAYRPIVMPILTKDETTATAKKPAE